MLRSAWEGEGGGHRAERTRIPTLAVVLRITNIHLQNMSVLSIPEEERGQKGKEKDNLDGDGGSAKFEN